MKTNYTPLRFFQNAAQEFSKGSEKIAIDSPTGAKLPQQTEQHRNMITIRYVKLLGKVEDLVERKCYILSAFFARMAEKLYKRKNRMANGAGGDEWCQFYLYDEVLDLIGEVVEYFGYTEQGYPECYDIGNRRYMLEKIINGDVYYCQSN